MNEYHEDSEVPNGTEQPSQLELALSRYLSVFRPGTSAFADILIEGLRIDGTAESTNPENPTDLGGAMNPEDSLF